MKINDLIIVRILTCMTYCPMMDVVSFPIGFNVTKIVSVSDSAKSGSYFAIISAISYEDDDEENVVDDEDIGKSLLKGNFFFCDCFGNSV